MDIWAQIYQLNDQGRDVVLKLHLLKHHQIQQPFLSLDNRKRGKQSKELTG